MRYYGACPASCGEFIQGMLNDKEYLVSYAVDMYSKAIIEERKCNVKRGPYKARKALEQIFKYFNFNVNYTRNLSLSIESNIPVGKGMASSSADIGATIYATLKFLDKSLSFEEISKIAAKVEPTDSIYIEENCIFDPLKGEIYKKLGYVDGIKVLVLEPDETLNTLSIRSKPDYYLRKENNKPLIKEAFSILEEGFKNNDLRLIGKACTLSGTLNENIHKKDGLSEIIKVSEEFGAYGVNIAHSGTVIAILLDKEMNEKRLKEQLISSKLDKKYKKIYSLDVIRGGIQGGVIDERINSISAWK